MSWPLSYNIEQTFENIKKDLVSFANTNTLVWDQVNPRTAHAVWNERQLSKAAKFTITKSQISVTYQNITTTYTDFLASSYMADLRHTANQLLSLVTKCATFVPQHAIMHDDTLSDEKGTPQRFDAVINDIITSPELDNDDNFINATQVIFVKGPAGTGKTISVLELTRNQAQSFLTSKTSFLYFYIDAQARALSRIGEAIAQETQDYGLSFTHSAVNALTRNNLIVPIIDGFDELIGSGGFADAFKSLSSFLSSLERCGSLIATSRSTFFDTNILGYIADQFNNNDSINYKLYNVDVTFWTDEDIKQYFELRFHHEPNKQAALQYTDKLFKSLSVHNKELLRKPFYCAQLASLVLSEIATPDTETNTAFKFDEEGDAFLLELLIDYFLKREKGKYRNRQDVPILDIEGHKRFLELLSLELWWQESRVIDQETLNAVAELIVEEFAMPTEDQPIFFGKVSSHALLRTDKSTGVLSLSFENAAYYDFFLLSALLRLLLTDTEPYIRQFLSRSLLSESLIEYFQIKTHAFDSAEIIQLVEKIGRALEQAPAGGLARKNGGLLVCALLSNKKGIDNILIKNIEGYEVSLAGFVTHKANFTNCLFRDIKLYDASIIDSTLTNTSFSKVLISSNTRFDGTILEPGVSISHIIDDNQRDSFDPATIADLIVEHGGTVPVVAQRIVQMNDKQKNIIELLRQLGDKVAGRFCFDIDPDNEPKLKTIVRNPCWNDLLKLLLNSGLLEIKRRDRAGKNQYLYRFPSDVEIVLSCIANAAKAPNVHVQRFISSFWSTH